MSLVAHAALPESPHPRNLPRASSVADLPDERNWLDNSATSWSSVIPRRAASASSRALASGGRSSVTGMATSIRPDASRIGRVQELAQALRNRLVGIRERVRIGPQRHRRVGVAEAAGDGAHVAALADRRGR